MKIPSRATTLDHRRSSSRCADTLSSALVPQAEQQMQVFLGKQQQPRQSRSVACAMIPNQQNFTRQDEPSSRAAKSGKFTLLSRVIHDSDILLEVLSSQNRKSFEYFFCFLRTLGISPKHLERFKADIAFIYTVLACSLTIPINLNFDFDFCNAKFHWSARYQMRVLIG